MMRHSDDYLSVYGSLMLARDVPFERSWVEEQYAHRLSGPYSFDG